MDAFMEKNQNPKDANMRSAAETQRMAHRVVKAMLEMAPEPHTKVQRRAKRARAKATRRIR
jgi:hypothetical protein